MANLSIVKRLLVGWNLTKSAAKVIQSNKRLVLVGLASFICSVALIIAYLVWGLHFYTAPSGKDSVYTGIRPDAWSWVGLVLLLVTLTIVRLCFAAVISRNALAKFSGQRESLMDSIRVVRDRLSLLGSFGIFTSTLGIIMVLIARYIPFGGRLLSQVGGTAWRVVSFFAVPVIVSGRSRLNSAQVVQKSTGAIGKLWQESVSAMVAIWLVGLIITAITYVVATLVAQLVFVATNQSALSVTVVAITISALVLFQIITIAVVATIVKAALYYYCEHKKAPAAFDSAALRSSMTVKKAQKVFQ